MAEMQKNMPPEFKKVQYEVLTGGRQVKEQVKE